MLCVEMDLDRRSGLIVARSQIYDICETLYIYYNCLISVLCCVKIICGKARYFSIA